MQPQLQTGPNSGIPHLATDPPVSEAQRRAMWAAKEGHSTLGIPKSVGEKFVGHGHDEKDDATRGAGVALRDPDGRLLFVRRQGGDAAGTWAFPGGYAQHGETEEAAAIRELEEELGYLLRQPLRVTLDAALNDEGFRYTTFLHDTDNFQPKLNGEHSGYVWAKPEEAPKPLHPGVEKVIDQKDIFAHDNAFAFDRASVRSIDPDGRMHVASTNISKANVCPYVGKEIPNWQDLGLDPNKIYHLLRDPQELAKAAPTFNNLPVLSKHVPVTAEKHEPQLVIGSTGTDAEFKPPYLRNSMVLWAKDAVDAVQNGSKKELSAAYRYRADMTPGNYEGSDYDGIMREIIGNHVATVEEGRAGPDIVVGDSKETITKHKQETTMQLSRKAVLAQGALTVFLRPKLAQDAKLPDLVPILADVSQENFTERKPVILGGVMKAMTGIKLAKDAKLDDLTLALDAIEDLQPVEEKKEPPPVAAGPLLPAEGEKPGPDDEKKKRDEGLKAFLKGKISEDDMAAFDALLGGAPAGAAAPAVSLAGDAKPNKDKQAMDEKTINQAVKVATDAAIKVQKDIREAEKAVRPWVGELAVAQDSAEGVYRTALGMLSVTGIEDVKELAALKAILAAQPKPGSKKDPVTTIAHDAAMIDSFNKRFPGAARIGSL